MKLSLNKSNDQYKLFIEKNDGKKEKFDYIKFINMLYDGDNIEKINYDSNITQEEREQIDKMIDDIDKIIKKKD